MVIFLNSTRGRGDTGTIQSRLEREGGVGTKTQASQLRDEAMRVEREMSISSKRKSTTPQAGTASTRKSASSQGSGVEWGGSKAQGHARNASRSDAGGSKGRVVRVVLIGEIDGLVRIGVVESPTLVERRYRRGNERFAQRSGLYLSSATRCSP